MLMRLIARGYGWMLAAATLVAKLVDKVFGTSYRAWYTGQPTAVRTHNDTGASAVELFLGLIAVGAVIGFVVYLQLSGKLDGILADMSNLTCHFQNTCTNNGMLPLPSRPIA